MDAKNHWDTVYRAKGPAEVSWFQREPQVSLQLIEQAAPSRSASILDAGGGASTLVDHLVGAGYTGVTVLDVSQAALEQAKTRLGPQASAVRWLCADLLEVTFDRSVDVWHDRAVFHFLTAPDDRRKYVAQVRRAVRPGGHVIVATFATDGPLKCSGLEVCRYNPESLHGEFGPDFELLRSVREEHITPWGAPQAFVYCLCAFRARRVSAA